MKYCLPVDRHEGLMSEISPNFRTAPALLLVDSETRAFTNMDAGNCGCDATPMQIDAIICAGGIGRGMFNNLRQNGVRVYFSNALTVDQALSEMAAGSLEEVNAVACCSGHQPTGYADPAAAHGCCGSQGDHSAHDHGHGRCGCGHP